MTCDLRQAGSGINDSRRSNHHEYLRLSTCVNGSLPFWRRQRLSEPHNAGPEQRATRAARRERLKGNLFVTRAGAATRTLHLPDVPMELRQPVAARTVMQAVY